MITNLPEEAYAIALAMTPDTGPARLRELLSDPDDPPSAVWTRVTAPSTFSREDVAAVWRRHMDLGITVLLREHPAYPQRVVDDPYLPAVLFCLGDPEVLNRHAKVAVIGTRSPTRYGVGVAAQFGAELAAAGVSVVSGLALGIDGAAHEGACGAGAPPIGVVAGGLHDPYPRRHARLWARVAEKGVIVSESPVGVRTEKWRFPARNRLMAAMCNVVVVVESRYYGGSRLTVEAAVDRSIPVGAVPGSIRSPTSEGTNELLAVGAFPVCSSADVLAAVARGDAPRAVVRHPKPRVEPLDGVERQIYDLLTYEPTSLDDLLRCTGLGLAALCGALERLATAGVARDVGGWWERA